MAFRARAIYDYEARASDELSFKRHDIINVLGKDEEDEGWYKGELKGKSGLFPNNYVQFVEDPPPPPAPTAASAATSTTAASTASSALPSTASSALPSAPPPPPAVQLPDYIKETSFESSFALAETLGRGRFSQVRRCTQVPGGRSCAVKIMELADPELGSSEDDAEREVLAEVQVLRMVEHPGIVQLLETVKDAGKYYLVLEDLSGGDLFDRIEQNGPFKEEDAGPLVRQVVSAVNFLHEKGIVHRDIKPDNLVFDSRHLEARIKLIDFGYAGHCTPSTPLRGLCGTPDYAAPEILVRTAGYGPAPARLFARPSALAAHPSAPPSRAPCLTSPSLPSRSRRSSSRPPAHRPLLSTIPPVGRRRGTRPTRVESRRGQPMRSQSTCGPSVSYSTSSCAASRHSTATTTSTCLS